MDAGSVVFDRYRLEERIGVGGMGVVWRATDLLLHQPVALKRVSLAGVDNQHAELTRDRALREARLRAHRHVVAIYDVRVDDGDVWLVLEYLPSRSLAQVVSERGPLGAGEVARIGAQVADALAVAHAAGIEHRDVTPGNVLITDDGSGRLTDFGISHLAGDIQLTQTGVISGTFAYLASEVCSEQRQAGTQIGSMASRESAIVLIGGGSRLFHGILLSQSKGMDQLIDLDRNPAVHGRRHLRVVVSGWPWRRQNFRHSRLGGTDWVDT